MEVATKRTAERPRHPSVRELVGGHDISVRALREHAQTSPSLVSMMKNADYWLAFDVAAFEPLLSLSPSPIRELGVAILLRFGDDARGTLSVNDVASAKEEIAASAPEPQKEGLLLGISCLERAITAREALASFIEQGFALHQPEKKASVATLRMMGNAEIGVGANPVSRTTAIEVGVPVVVWARDERKKPLSFPEIEGDLLPPVYVRDGSEREVLFVISGRYRLWVPGRADARASVIAR